MADYNLNTSGGYLRTTNTGASNFYPLLARHRSLSSMSSHGDFKTPTPYSFVKREYGPCFGWSYMTGGSWWVRSEGYGCGGDSVTPSNAFYAVALDPYNKCLEKLYGKIRSDIDLSIDIYQGKQTVRMIADFYSAIRHPIASFQKLSRSFAKDHKMLRGTKLAGSKWLEWQYGVRPTLSTIHSLSNDLVSAISSPDGIPLVKARATEKSKDVRTLTTMGNFWHSVVPATVTSTDSRRCQIALAVTLSNADINALSQFTSLNPVSFFYENIPFSFVLDWAYDVGGYLRMTETALLTGLQFHSGYLTSTRSREGAVKVYGSASEWGTYHVADLQGSCFERTLSRSILTSMPLPKLPSIDVNLGSARLLSAASLLSNFLNIPPSKRR